MTEYNITTKEILLEVEAWHEEGYDTEASADKVLSELARQMYNAAPEQGDLGAAEVWNKWTNKSAQLAEQTCNKLKLQLEAIGDDGDMLKEVLESVIELIPMMLGVAVPEPSLKIITALVFIWIKKQCLEKPVA